MRVVVVSGPPCAGKSTYIAEHRGTDDVVIDLDALAHTLGYPHEHLTWPTDAHPARAVALRARASALKAARGIPVHATVWVVHARLPEDFTCDERIELDPGRDVCRDRAAADGRDLRPTFLQIDEWYAWRDATTQQGSRTW